MPVRMMRCDVAWEQNDRSSTSTPTKKTSSAMPAKRSARISVRRTLSALLPHAKLMSHQRKHA